MVGNSLLNNLQNQSNMEMSLQAYQKWLRKNIPLLIYGDITTWAHYTVGKDYILGRFPELRPHMAPDIRSFLETHEEPFTKETVCTRLGINRSFLLKLEQDGYLHPPCGEPPSYSYEDERKLYWAFFFEKEMGMSKSGLEALLSFVDHIEAMAESYREMLHELGTPLHVIGGRANLLKRKFAGSEIAEKNLTIVQHQVEKMIALLQQYHSHDESIYPGLYRRRNRCE